MCLLSLLAKRHEYGNLWLLWLLFFLQNNHKTSTCLVLCLKYGLIWAHVVPASLLRIYIYIISLFSGLLSQISLRKGVCREDWFRCSKWIRSCRWCFCLPSAQIHHLSVLCSSFSNIFAPFSKHRMKFLCRFLCPKHR